MRVIAGSARRLNLMTPKGSSVRPTTDRIKETLFNIIQDDVPGSRFLDWFAGSGGIGIEALSRGASFCVFADASRSSISCIRANLAHTHFEQCSRVYACDYKRALGKLKNEEPFDIIFLDPPYQKGLEEEALKLTAAYDLLNDDGLIIIETLLDTEYDGNVPECFYIEREKKYKSNKHLFLRKR